MKVAPRAAKFASQHAACCQPLATCDLLASLARLSLALPRTIEKYCSANLALLSNGTIHKKLYSTSTYPTRVKNGSGSLLFFSEVPAMYRRRNLTTSERAEYSTKVVEDDNVLLDFFSIDNFFFKLLSTLSSEESQPPACCDYYHISTF